MNSAELLEIIDTFYSDKLTLRNRHVAAARYVTEYNANNTYQYVINRDDMHVRWLQDAITDLGGTPAGQPVPDIDPGKGAAAATSVMTADRDASAKFVARWRPRLDAMPNARHRTLLNVILGESLEQQRFFEQALAGREDLLGRRDGGKSTGGTVLPDRWVG
ncbi:MAG: hypothetical protein ABIP65_03425 [Vicinamibacterales bacterium]